MDNFIIDLYSLAEHCQYGRLHDEMVRDRIVVDIKDFKLSEKLQMDNELTLEKAISLARNSKSVKQQQSTIRTDLLTEPKIEQIKAPATNVFIPVNQSSATPIRVNNPEPLMQILAPGVARHQHMQKQTALLEKLCVTSVKRKDILKLIAGAKHL